MLVISIPFVSLQALDFSFDAYKVGLPGNVARSISDFLSPTCNSRSKEHKIDTSAILTSSCLSLRPGGIA